MSPPDFALVGVDLKIKFGILLTVAIYVNIMYILILHGNKQKCNYSNAKECSCYI